MRPPEEVKAELVQQWLAKAESDLGVADHLLSPGTPYVEAIGFHAQQASEKYLKAFLVEHQIEFQKTHDLGQLLDLVSSVDPSLASTLSDVPFLTPYGVGFRYPGHLARMSADDAGKAVALARSTRQAILKALGKPA
ncbi:MAG: HEPN domain-containing protein [Armatimonadota bacterium]|jgi:HEPN domain-containing protein